MKPFLHIVASFLLSAIVAAPTQAQSPFTSGNLVIVRVGDGSGALSSAATPLFLEERTTSGSLVQTIAIPSSGTGRITLSGTATSEGGLGRSPDGGYLTMGGFDADATTTSVASTASSATNRIFAIISPSASINTLTKLTDAYSGSDIRGVVTNDGTAFWGAGTTSSGSSAGCRYALLAGTTSTQVLATPSNTRRVKIFNGQLYGSASSGTFTNVYTIGTGLPTTTGQTATSLPGMPTSSRSPYDFSISPNGDTLYVADDGSAASDGGIQKWTWNGSTWTKAYTLLNNGSTTTAVRGLTVDWSGGNPVIYATTTTTSANSLIKVTDTGSGSTATVLVTAGTNTVYRGIDFAPVAVPTNPTGTGAATPTTVVAGSGTLLTVAVTPGTNPSSTGLTVTGDLSSIGGSSTQAFYDDGTHGDVASGDNTFSYQATVSSLTTPGNISLPMTVADAQSRSSNPSISLTVTAIPPVDSVVVSQIYGGGGNTGAAYQNDYIELFNRSSSGINLSGWSVQYATTVGSSWSVTNLSGTIAPGGYFLIQEASGGANGSLLPTPDATGTIAMATGAGKVTLLNVTTVLSGSCPTGGNIVDFVGYGTGTNCFEGSGPTPSPGNTAAAFRGSNGCVNTHDNSSDFSTAAPNPRNTASASNPCVVPTNPTGSGSAAPSTVTAGNGILLTVNVTPGTNPPSTAVTVVADLSSIGGSSTQTMYDDGTHGDVTNGDNIFSYQATISKSTAAGLKLLTMTVADAQVRSTNDTVSLTVTPRISTTVIHADTNPSSDGHLVTFTATVSDSGSPVITGSVTFKESTIVLSGPTSLDVNGQASFNTSTLAVGTHTITAVYAGAPNYATSRDSLVQTVLGLPITISGASFSDHNNNGGRDSGDAGLAGWKIFLDLNDNGALDNGEDSTVTDSAGNYNFLNIPPGTYKVREVHQTGWWMSTPNPSDISSTTSNVDFGNHDTLRPEIISHWTWDDSAYQNQFGPYFMRAIVTDNAVTDSTRANSYFDVFFDLSIDSGVHWSSVPMNFQPTYDYSTDDGGAGDWWTLEDGPPGGYAIGTVLQARVRAVDVSGNTIIVPCGGVTIAAEPVFPTVIRSVPTKRQSVYEGLWFGKPSNSWCGPVAASALLQSLGIYFRDTTHIKIDLVEDLAKNMNTDGIAKNGAFGSGQPGTATSFGMRDSINGAVYGLIKVINLLGYQDSTVISVYNPSANGDVMPNGVQVHPDLPTFADFKRELKKGEGIMVRLRYGFQAYDKQTDAYLGGHWVVGVDAKDGSGGNPDTIIVMDPGSGKYRRIPWSGPYGKFAGGDVTIKSLVVVSPIPDLRLDPGSGSPNGKTSQGTLTTPHVVLENTHNFETAESVFVKLSIPSIPYVSIKMVPEVLPGQTQDVAFDDVNLSTKGTFDATATIESRNGNSNDDTLQFSFTVVDSQKFRSFSYDSLANDKDNKGKVGKFVKRKPDKVQVKLKFQAPAAATGFELKFNMNFTGNVYSDTFKNVPLTAISALKDLAVGTTVTNGQIFQLDGFGDKGKLIAVTVIWQTAPKVTKVVYKVPTDFVINQPKLPMPNRVNALSEAFEQGGFSAMNGLMVGIAAVDSPKAYGWLLAPKYTDVLKSLYDKGAMQTGPASPFGLLISSKPVAKQQKSLPPSKYQNILLADLIVLKFNIEASALGKIPPGFGELIYDDYTSTPLNGMMVKDIAKLADSMMMARSYTARFRSKTNYDGLIGYSKLDTVVEAINSAFEGPLDTAEFSGKLHFKGMRSLIDVPYLSSNPNIQPTIIPESATLFAQVPEKYSLYQNYPNPFNPTTTIQFDLPEQAVVTLKIYTMLGQEVTTLFDHQLMDEGTQEVQFNANTLASGVYFYRIVAQGMDDDGLYTSTFATVKKMLLLK